ncbi:MAG: ATP-binding protein, partial [Bacteroidota bacterium]
KIDTDNAWLQLAINATRFNLQGETYMLVSVQNIGAELEDQELEAVQHMTRVLAHEIMNSITPIASLAGSARHHLEANSTDKQGEIPEALVDLRDALDTIEKRSQGLLNFVNSYRQIARIPRPDFQLVEVGALFRRVSNLLGAQANDVDLKIDVEPANLTVLADPDQMEQVLINLTKNAIESLEGKENGQVRLEGSLSRRSRVTLKVTDNGSGIAAENQSQIFVPFYSTKATGSGIGLSLSRQIMRRHGGSLRVQSKLGGPTSFLMHF